MITHVLGLAVVGEACPGVVEGVDEEERHGSRGTATGNVCGKLQGLRGVLGGLERSLDSVLEGKVQRLSREVPQHICQVSCVELRIQK